MCPVPSIVKRGVGEGLGTDERPEQVVRLEARHVGHARRPVPVLERPPSGQGHGHQPRVGVQGVRMPHRGEDRYVVDAVRVDVAVGQVDGVGRRPLPDLVPLAASPREPPHQPSRVGPVDLLVPGGHHVVEVERPGQRCDQVERGGGGQHDEPTLGPVGSERLERPRLDQVDQLLDGRRAGPAHRCGRPSLHQAGRRPGEAHERRRLAEGVVVAVEVALPGQGPAGRQHPLGDHRRLQDRPAGRADQGPVEVHEDGTGGVGHALNLPPPVGSRWRGSPHREPAGSPPRRSWSGRRQPERPLDAAKGPPGGERWSLRTDATRLGGGFLRPVVAEANV